MTVEVPWDSIKYRFNGFFIVSILFLVFSLTFDIVNHSLQGFQKYTYISVGIQIVFNMQLLLGTLGLLGYFQFIEEKFIQEHQHDTQSFNISSFKSGSQQI